MMTEHIARLCRFGRSWNFALALRLAACAAWA